ncbi:transposase, partial [Saccharospirillum impatiens]
MTLSLSPLKRRKVEVDFTGGDLTSDAGLVLFREVDKKLGLSRQLDKVLDDPRCTGRVLHPQIDLLRQRL